MKQIGVRLYRTQSHIVKIVTIKNGTEEYQLNTVLSWLFCGFSKKKWEIEKEWKNIKYIVVLLLMFQIKMFKCKTSLSFITAMCSIFEVLTDYGLFFLG